MTAPARSQAGRNRTASADGQAPAVRTQLAALAALATAALSLLAPPPAHAVAPSVRLLAVPWAGCEQGSPPLQLEIAGAVDAGASLVVRLEANGKVYYRESVPIRYDDRRNWRPYAMYTGVPESQRGTWPLPAGHLIRADLRLEAPDGALLDEWATVIDSCDSGVVLFNGPPSADRDRDLVTTRYDACPTVAAPRTTDGCPTLARSIRLARSGRAVTGQVRAPHPALAANQQVLVYREVAGADRLIARVRTDRAGRFRVKPGRKVRQVYAVAPAVLVPTAGRAPQTTSRALTLR